MKVSFILILIEIVTGKIMFRGENEKNEFIYTIEERCFTYLILKCVRPERSSYDAIVKFE